MVLVSSGFHTQKNLSENYPQFGHALSKSFAGPVLCRKSLRISVWRDAKLLACPGRPPVSGRLCL